MKLTKHILTLLFITLFNVSFLCQNGTIRGTVYEAENGEPSIGTNVKIKGTGVGASTDINGFYQITKLETGTYILVFSNIEFKTIEKEIQVTSGKIVTKNFFMEENDEVLDEFEVSAEAA